MEPTISTGIMRRPDYVPAEPRNDMDRLEAKIDALRLAIESSSGAERWSETGDPDPDFHSSKLNQYWRAIRLHKGLIIILAFIGLLGGFLFSLTQTPVYRAKTAIEILGLNDNFMDTKVVDPMERGYTSESYIQTQADKLTSFSLVNRAVHDSGLVNRQTQSERKSGFGEWLKALGIQRSTAKPTELDLTKTAIASLKATPRKGTRLIDIEYDSTDPSQAADFANRLAKVYLDTSLQTRLGASQQTSEVLNRELTNLEQRLKQAESEMQNYARNKNLVFANDTATVAEERLRLLQNDLAQAQADRISKESSFEVAKNGASEALPQSFDSPTLREYQSKLPGLKQELAKAKTIYQPGTYQVRSLETQIKEMEDLIDKERKTTVQRSQNELAAAQRREQMLSQAMMQQSKVVSQQSNDAVTYNLLKGQVDTYKRLYDDMLQKVKTAGIATAFQPNTAQIVEPAQAPDKPYTPNVPMTCGIGLMAGVMGAVMLLIMRDQADRTVKNPGDAQLFVNLPELAVIPSLSADPYLRSLPSESSSMQTRIFKNGSGRQSGLPARAPELAVWRYKSTLLAETIRGLLTSILFSTRDERSLRVLVLTSAGAGEGKSTITSNLAVAMAEVHQRVLLIDADARKPRLHSIFNLPNEAGLTTILTSHKPLTHADLESVIVKSHIPGLSVLPSGPCFDSISTLLHSARLNEMLHMLRTSYDSILIDTPPVLQVPDARVLGRRADAVILVARAAKTTRDALQAARQRFHDDGVPVLGAILNGWSPKADSSFGYYNPEYYQNRKTATQ